MENNTEHRPDPEEDGWCACGGQEVYFEGHALDPGDLGPVVGYGCDALGRPYARTLDRRGWHVNRNHRDRIVESLTDEEENELSDEEFDKVMRHRYGPRR